MPSLNDAMNALASKTPDLETFKQTNIGNVTDWCPTFLPNVDRVMLGGIPLSGKVTEIYGDPQVGKTTLALEAIKTLTENGALVFVFDTEGTTSNTRMLQLGVDPSKVGRFTSFPDKNDVMQPITIEDVFQRIRYMTAEIRSGSNPVLKPFQHTPIVFFWDTIANTLANTEKKAGLQHPTVGQQAHALSIGFRLVAPTLTHQNATMICLNQGRSDIKGNPLLSKYKVKTTGGHGLDHAVSLKILMRGGNVIKDSNQIGFGHQAHIQFSKSKIGDNYGAKADIDILARHGNGCDPYWNVYHEARDKHVRLIRGTAWQAYQTLGGKLIKKHGSSQFIKFLASKEGEPIYNELWQRLTKKCFPNCYPALFNQHMVLSSKEYPFLKGLRAYYIKRQENIDPRLQNTNYKIWKRSHQNEVKKVMK